MNNTTSNSITIIIVVTVIILTACTSTNIDTTNQDILTIMTHDSFSISEQVLLNFESKYDVQVNILTSGDAGTMINLAILNKENPIADLLYGIDNTLLSRAINEDLFESYQSDNLSYVSDIHILDENHYVTPVNYGDVCINYDKSYFKNNNLKVPESLTDLLNQKYSNLLVTQNPASSSTGLAFLLTTIGHFGQEEYLNYWSNLKQNGVKIVEDWESSYYTEFSGSSGNGKYPMVVSYASSPPAEVIFSETPITEAPTSSIVASETCFRQIEFIGIIKGTTNRKLSEHWIDFVLTETFQEDIPMQMFMFPVNGSANLPSEFVKHAQLAKKTSIVAPEDIEQNRDQWIKAWSDLMIN